MARDTRNLGVVWLALGARWLFSTVAAATALGTQQTGFITFYSDQLAPAAALNSGVAALAPAPAGGLLSGACGYGELPATAWPFGRIVALGPNNSIATGIGANKLACGQCVMAKCTSSNCASGASDGTVLLVTDGCAGCADNQLNVPADAFLEHFGSTLGLGRVSASFQEVDCSPTGNIRIRVVAVQPSGGVYIALSFIAVAGSGMLAGVDIKTSGSQTWAPMANGYGSVWQASNVGSAPLDVRLTSFQGSTVVAIGAITELREGIYSTRVQFGPTAPAVAPLAGATVPSIAAGATLPTYAPRIAPAISASAPADSASLLLGTRVTVPLYYQPADVTLLGAYPGIVWSYVDCFGGSPVLNLTVTRMRLVGDTTCSLQVPSATGAALAAYALHTLEYRKIPTTSPSQIYEITDYSFYNLETGQFAQLYQPAYASFTNPLYTGMVPVQNLETSQAIYPIFIPQANLTGPAGFDYTVLLPPGPNEDPTPAYVEALQVLFYALSTLTLGNPGEGEEYIPCAPGYAQIGPWADYVRSILVELAPTADIVGEFYNNIPLGPGYAFEGTSFVINNAILVGNVINTTVELSSLDCGSRCRSTLPGPGETSGICSVWSWCGSISGCNGGVAYRTCLTKNSTAALPTILPSGMLNLQQNNSIRITSGSLTLPPPEGLNFSSSLLNYTGPPTAYGLSTTSAGAAATPR